MTTPPRQGQDQLVITAASGTIWAIIEDTAQLPAWVPMVDTVDVPVGRREHMGAVRTCQVRMMGRRGQITERCTDLVPGRRVSYVVDNDTLGFTRLATEFGFTIELEAVDPTTTTVTLASFYHPRGLPGRLANVILLRRRLRWARRTMLAQLKRLAEGSVGRDVS